MSEREHREEQPEEGQLKANGTDGADGAGNYIVLFFRRIQRGVRQFFIAPIRFYKRFISPALPPSCRYYPSCSSYAMEAIEKRGVIIGMALGAWRILRCNPWSHGGYDPVPLGKKARRQHGGCCGGEEKPAETKESETEEKETKEI